MKKLILCLVLVVGSSVHGNQPVSRQRMVIVHPGVCGMQEQVVGCRTESVPDYSYCRCPLRR